MKICRCCGVSEAVVSIVTKLGGYTKRNLCDPCYLKEEKRLSSEGTQFKKREIKKRNIHWT